MAKKTVSLRKIVDIVNRRNAMSTCAPDIRTGWNSLLESVLMDANAYNGFGYLQEGQIPPGHEPGIIRGTTPNENVFPDESRRVYYLKTS